MLFVGHFYHPLFDTVVDQAFKSKWDTLRPLPGANWMSPEIMHFKSERPRLFSKDLPTVFVLPRAVFNAQELFQSGA